MRAKLGEAKWIGAAAAVAVVAGLTVSGCSASGKTADGPKGRPAPATTVVAVAGGGQPEDVLPANAMAFAKVDLNPSVTQKVAVFRLAAKFPKLKVNENIPLKESIFGSVFTGPTAKSGFGLDYKKDVEPWLGDRIGVGVFPDMNGDETPEVGVAVQVTDEKAAKVAIDKKFVNAERSPGAKPNTTGYAFADGYVILSDTTAHATALAAAGKVGSLAKSKYGEDVAKLGSDQIGVAWADIAAAYKAIPADQLGKALGPLKESLKGVNDPKNASGRVVMGLHADPSFLDVTGRAIDLRGLGSSVQGGSGTSLIASFPADVFLAVSMTGLGKQAGALYTSLTANGDSFGIRPALDRIGISSAKHFETLLGAETGLMAHGTSLAESQLEFAYRTRGSDAEAAMAMARRLVNAYPNGGRGITYSKITGPDGIVVAQGPGLTAAIFDKSGSRLGGTDAFKQVMPDAGKADFAAYVDLGRYLAMVPTRAPERMALLKPIEALGITAAGGAEPSFRLRLSIR